MALEQQIMVELKAAMLAKDEAALRGLRAIKAAILLAKTADGKQSEKTSSLGHHRGGSRGAGGAQAAGRLRPVESGAERRGALRA